MRTHRDLFDKGHQLAGRIKNIVKKSMPPGTLVQFGVLYRLPLSQDILPMMDGNGLLPNGKRYHILCVDETGESERERENRHLYIYCCSEGRDVGHVHFWLGEKDIDELETRFHFDGWYLYDAYVDPQFRRNGIYRLLTEYGLKVARETGLNGKYLSAFTECSRSVSGRALDRMGFRRESFYLFVKLFGRKKLFQRTLYPEQNVSV